MIELSPIVRKRGFLPTAIVSLSGFQAMAGVLRTRSELLR